METINKTLTKANSDLVKATELVKTINVKRTKAVNDIITATIEYASTHKDVFSTKKTAVKIFLSDMLEDKAADNMTKRAVRIAKTILVDGYSIKYNLLSLAQMEQLTKFSKSSVKKLFVIKEDDEYIDAVKELIKSAKVEKTTKVFSARKAKEL